MNDTAIRVENISKLYKLYDNPRDRLKESLGLTKEKLYKEHYALHDVSFDIQRGETVGIIGTNGAGKSTVLKIITGVLNPTQGQVEVNGRISALLELGAGFNMEYTGIENVYLNGTMIGFSKEEIDAKLQDILDFADIGDFVYQPVKTYSSGMFVRLAFAVAINIDPEILIVDEALSVGDVFFQTKCFKKFEEFKKLGKTILFVSHDLGSISRYCDRVVLLNKGTKMAEGTPKEMVSLYKRLLVGQEALVEEELEQNGKDSRPDIPKTENGLWKENYQINPNLKEEGNKKAEIIDFAIIDENDCYTGSMIKGTEFTIKIKVLFREKIENPVISYSFCNVKGVEITGTSTECENIYIGEVQAEEIYTATFVQKMYLQGGEYFLTISCSEKQEDGNMLCHRLEKVCNVTVVSDKNTVGFYDMNTTVEIRKVED